MPVATSSRRKKSARQASSDIEEDQPTQGARAARDDVDDDDDDAPRRTKKEKAPVKKEGVKKENGKARQVEEEEDDEDDEDDRIDIANFADQPLSKADGPKILGLSKDWQSVEGVMHQPASIINGVAAAMAEVGGDEALQGLAELDRVMKGLLDVQSLMTGHSKVLNDIIQSVARGENITDVNTLYLSLADDMNAEYDKKTTRQKYLKNEEYMAFKEAIYVRLFPLVAACLTFPQEVENPGSAMPPMTDFIPREPGDESDDEDEIVMGGVTQEYKCPLSLTPLKDPMTSSVCNHSFSGEAIREFFKNKRGAQKCPASGCSKSFTLAECKPNADLARKVKAVEKRQARAQQQEDSDAEEVID
ncbi:hypothetical protein B0H12DRAFT_559458 [Mycena haematopus]|nr:hypothetical protein B0H12DRAFT_559458 [Mycena haematopus]